MKNQFKNKKAFTLIELLIVIAIIGILFIVLVSKVDFATDKAKATGVKTDFRSFQMAFDTVATENAGFTSLITTDYEKLEAAVNKHLDSALKVDIDAMGKISMVNGTTDPWKVPYHGEVVVGDDGLDRGAIVLYSNGPNMQFGSRISLTGGITSINTTGDAGKDDYVIISCYSLVNGYGEVQNMTTGFSNNQLMSGGNVDNENEPVITTTYGITFSDGVTLSWNDVMLMENADKYGYMVGSVYETYVGFSAFDRNTQVVTLVAPNSVTKIDEYAFIGSSLKSVYLENVTTINEAGFANCTQLTSVVLSKNLTNLGTAAFAGCTSLNSIEFKGTMAEWNSITKGDSWKEGVLATYVQCSDGQVNI